MGRWLFTLLLVAATPAAADQITSFSPDEVTFGTEVTILGDFTTLAAAGKDPRVVGSRMDLNKTVKFTVLSVSSSEIHAVATKFPKSKTDPVAGKEFDLTVVPPKGAGVPLLAPEKLVPVAPELLDVGSDSGEPGETLALSVDDVGTGKLTVLFGTKKAKLTDPPPVLAASTPAAATPLFVIVPKLPSGSYPISLLNGIGPSLLAIAFDLVVPPKQGGCPSLVATLSGKPNYDSKNAFYSLGSLGGLFSCENDDSPCGRDILANFDPSVALANPGQSFVVTTGINYFEEDPNPMQPGDQWGGPAQLSFEADSANGPIHGSFSAVLQAVQPNMGASINISALFCAIATP